MNNNVDHDLDGNELAVPRRTPPSRGRLPEPEAEPEPERKGRQGSEEPNFAAMLAKRRFDYAKEPAPLCPLFCLSGQVIGTPGNMSTITASTKAGKSAVVGAMVAAAIGPPGRDYLGFSALENKDGLALLHFDTEQSPDDHWFLVARALKRAGLREPPEWLYSYCLTGMDYLTAWACVCKGVRLAARQCDGVQAILLDGVADLVANVNDPAECNSFVAELHDLAIREDCHIVGVIHFNPGSEKTRGHLGSQLERKAETNLRLDKEEGVTTIWSDKQRRAPIPKERGPRFEWSDEHQMHVSTASFQTLKADLKRDELQELALTLVPIGKTRTYSELIDAQTVRRHGVSVKNVDDAKRVSLRTASRRIKEMVSLGLISHSGANGYKIRVKQ